VRDLEQGRTHAPRWVSVQALASALGLDETERSQLLDSRLLAQQAGSLQVGDVVSGSEEPLTIRVLGQFHVDRAGTSLQLGPPRPRAILALLALRGDDGVRMSEFTDLLWPADEPVSAKNVIQGQMTRLRRTLRGSISTEQGSRPAITWDGSHYKLDSSQCAIDSDRFALLVAAGDEATATGRHEVAYEGYERALDLWRGRVVADIDCLNDHPLATELNGRKNVVLIKYADAAARASASSRAITRLRHSCLESPLNELLLIKLMEALAASGQRSEAVNAFRQLQDQLDRELSIGPSELAWYAYRNIIRGGRPDELFASSQAQASD
jgi:DNA-binding SARP family transcriptional activator